MAAFDAAVDIQNAGVDTGFPAGIRVKVNPCLNPHRVAGGLCAGDVVQFGFSGVANHSRPCTVVFIETRSYVVPHSLVHIA